MFGIGLAEMAVIAVIAVVVFGPDKLPELARQAGRFFRQVRIIANSARDDLRRELGPEFADLELSDLDPRHIVRKHFIAAMKVEVEKERAKERSLARPGLRPLEEGEAPPFDLDAT